MPHCVFMHKADSIYDDIPAERYHFPAMYLSRAEPCIGDWSGSLEPRKVRNSRVYFAAPRVDKVAPALSSMQPHPAFLTWHREHCFKH